MGTQNVASHHHARGSRGALSEEEDDDDEERRRRRRRFRRPSSGKSDAREADEPVDTDGGVGRRRRGRCESEEENWCQSSFVHALSEEEYNENKSNTFPSSAMYVDISDRLVEWIDDWRDARGKSLRR